MEGGRSEGVPVKICLWPHRNGNKACWAQLLPVSPVTRPDPFYRTPFTQSMLSVNAASWMPSHSPGPGQESRRAIPTWWLLRFCLFGPRAGDEVEACCLGSSSLRRSQKKALGKGSTPGPRVQAHRGKTIPHRLMQPPPYCFSIS